MAEPNILPVPVSSSKSSGITKLTDSSEGIALGDMSQAVDGDNYNYTTEISFRAVEAVDVSVRNLSISVSQPTKWSLKLSGKKGGDEDQQLIKILDNVSVDVPAGQLMAIIGSSGSGKTSLLNVMAHRMRGPNLNITGVATYNGAPISSVRYAYVMQQDVLLPTLTVRETLKYSAELRLSSGTTREEREKVVEEIILQLGLKECADTLIGDGAHKGCSGGEKRRVSIGVQLLSNPSVLFLDEPTTGLDATSAFQLVRTLKNLAQNGRTIITTLHQPRSEIWGLFDRISLLAKGSLIFSGAIGDVPGYFERQEYPLPLHANPAEFLVDISAIDYRSSELEQASVERVQSLISAWCQNGESYLCLNEKISSKAGSKSTSGTNDDRKYSSKPPLFRQISVLTRRAFKTTYRDPMGLSGCIIEAILMAVLAGLIFLQLEKDLSGIRNRQAALYMGASLQAYLILLYETYRLCETDIRVFDRENGEGVVGVVPFLISRRLAKLPLEDFPVPIIFSVIFYFMVGFENDAKQFFIFFAVALLSHYLSITFATFTVAVSRNYTEASLMGNLSYTIQSMGCGFFVQAATMPVYVRWTKYISYNWYGLGALMANEFADKFYDCPPSKGVRGSPACIEYEGNFVLANLDYRRDWIPYQLLVQVAFIAVFSISAAIVFRFKPFDITMANQSKGDEKDYSAGKESLSQMQQDKIHLIDVVLDNYALNYKKSGFLGRGSVDKDILKGVSARFEHGKLNVILGPSGSGKSSLLNLMARRLDTSLTGSYTVSGKMTFNGSEPSDLVIQSLCSYVTQDDDALLPSLTVRETLRFAAALRLPSWMTSQQKEAKAEEVLLKMGLRDCADVAIGSEFVKGISGGQKRRVTIAVQILTEPRILLLDEPTSGLDAFTAASILTVLKGLADEGRTVVCTIHQSSNEVFEKFGNMLLLARGGYTAYSGPAAKMLSYFSSVGYECPRNVNPADFALDLVTVDLQEASREEESRVRVQNLTSKFSHADALVITADSNKTETTLPAEFGQMARQAAPFLISYPILLRRSMLNIYRQPPLFSGRIMQVVGLAIVQALYFAPLKNDYFAVQNRMGFAQQLNALYFVGMLQNIAIYPFERDVFYKEYADRAYGITSFFVAYTTGEIPFEIISAIIFACFNCLAVGLPRTAQMFFIIAGNALLVTNCGESVGIIFNTFFQHTGFSLNITSAVLSIGVIMGGILSTNMPAFLKAINFISPIKYAVQNIVGYSLKGVKFTCLDEQKVLGRCPIETGEDVLRLYKMEQYVPWKNLLGLVAAAVVYRLVAYGVLVLMRGGWRKVIKKT